MPISQRFLYQQEKKITFSLRSIIIYLVCQKSQKSVESFILKNANQKHNQHAYKQVRAALKEYSKSSERKRLMKRKEARVKINPGLALTGVRTTGPRCLNLNSPNVFEKNWLKKYFDRQTFIECWYRYMFVKLSQ